MIPTVFFTDKSSSYETQRFSQSDYTHPAPLLSIGKNGYGLSGIILVSFKIHAISFNSFSISDGLYSRQSI
jgi:hypothetical protein